MAHPHLRGLRDALCRWRGTAQQLCRQQASQAVRALRRAPLGQVLLRQPAGRKELESRDGVLTHDLTAIKACALPGKVTGLRQRETRAARTAGCRPAQPPRAHIPSRQLRMQGARAVSTRRNLVCSRPEAALLGRAPHLFDGRVEGRGRELRRQLWPRAPQLREMLCSLG